MDFLLLLIFIFIISVIGLYNQVYLKIKKIIEMKKHVDTYDFKQALIINSMFIIGYVFFLISFSYFAISSFFIHIDDSIFFKYVFTWIVCIILISVSKWIEYK